jgi:hypothetical protein
LMTSQPLIQGTTASTEAATAIVLVRLRSVRSPRRDRTSPLLSTVFSTDSTSIDLLCIVDVPQKVTRSETRSVMGDGTLSVKPVDSLLTPSLPNISGSMNGISLIQR